jgi:ATP-binding cassette subfamily B protein
MVVGAFAELATIGTLLPFLSLLAGVQQPGSLPRLTGLFVALGAKTPGQEIWVAGFLFGFIAVVAGIVRLWLTWSTQIFMAMLGHDLTVDIQRRILLQPYSFHVAHNSSHAVAAVEKVQSLVYHVLLQVISAVVAAFIAIFIIAALVYVDPVTAIVAATAFSLIYLLVSAIGRRRLAANSEAIATAYEERVRIMQESIGGIRDLIIDGSQRIYVDAFERVDRRFSVASATTTFIATAPRFVIESAGMVVIAVIALFVAQREGSLASALPVLGAVALGAQRLLPLLQQMYHGWASVSGHRLVLNDVLDLLKLEPKEEPRATGTIRPLPLRDRISVDGVSFAYPGRKKSVLEDITLQIPRGSSVALIGATGAGKSTLADLMMGLIEPTEGRIAVDGVPLISDDRLRWRKTIAHVPQAIFLADTSIARNISLAAPSEKINMARVRDAAERAQLDEFVSSLPDGYQTTVGEHGIRLSGGQRQRLGIARAIYKQAPVMILDEATSALDETTEAAVMHSLAELGDGGRTLIIIAHRLSTIAHCSLVIRLENGRVTKSGSYAEVVQRSRVAAR